MRQDQRRSTYLDTDHTTRRNKNRLSLDDFEDFDSPEGSFFWDVDVEDDDEDL